MDLGKSFNWSTDAFNRLEYAIGASGTYLTLVLLHRFLFPLKKVPKVGDFLAFQKIHNVILSLGSLLMFVGCLYEVRNRYLRENTAVWLLCEYESTPVQGR